MPEELTEQLPVVQNLDRPMTVGELAKQSHLLLEILDAVMVEGIHYGTVPGTDKPTLYLPGAEKICATFHLAPKPFIEDLSDVATNLYRYRVTVSLYSIGGALFVGSACGEASSLEEKYQWREMVCQPEWDETDPTRRRRKYKKVPKNWHNEEDNERGYLIIHQIQREAPDLANTVLKMAVKRAFVSATRGATAASDILDVDMEEDVNQDVAEHEEKEKPTKLKAKRPAPKIPYGKHQGKQINDDAIPIADLQWLSDSLAQRIDDPQAASYKARNQAMVLALDTEIVYRKKRQQPKEKLAEQPHESGNLKRPPMEDSAWKSFVDIAQSQFATVYDRILKEWGVAIEDVPVGRRWDFYDEVNNFAKSERPQPK